MTPEQFCYWLQGRAELDPVPPTPEQWQSIREHLDLVFDKVTPPIELKPPLDPVSGIERRARIRRAYCGVPSIDGSSIKLC